MYQLVHYKKTFHTCIFLNVHTKTPPPKKKKWAEPAKILSAKTLNIPDKRIDYRHPYSIYYIDIYIYNILISFLSFYTDVFRIHITCTVKYSRSRGKGDILDPPIKSVYKRVSLLNSRWGLKKVSFLNFRLYNG